MTAITLRNIPGELQTAIQKKAQTEGLSLNKAVQMLIAEAIGLKTGTVLYDDLDHLAGTWSAEEAKTFESALSDQRQIDPELWD